MSRDLDTVGESHGGLLAHIIDSRVAARDAPALLCPVERWQEAWFRDNSFLIACLIHTTSNYTAVPRASVPHSKSFRGRNSRRLSLPSLSLSLSVSLLHSPGQSTSLLFQLFRLAAFLPAILHADARNTRGEIIQFQINELRTWTGLTLNFTGGSFPLDRRVRNFEDRFEEPRGTNQAFILL